MPGRPVSFSARSTMSANPGSSNCRPDTLTVTATRYWAYQRRASVQACRSTQAPMAPMRPASSATGTKTSGPTSEPALRRQRTSASTATTTPVSNSTTGW